MKQLWIILLLMIGASAPLRAEKHALDIPAYIKVGDVSKNMETVAAELKAALESRGFEILGSYSPENNSNLRVIAYTRTDLKNAAVKVADRGAMAAVLKVGLVKKNHAVTVSYLNPPYLFNAYLRKETPKNQKVLGTVTADVKAAMGALGNEFTGFGGGMRAEKLWKYRYKIIMPDFGDREKLNTYSSFEKGLVLVQEPFLAPSGIKLRDKEFYFNEHSWSDNSLVRGHEGLSYQATALASYVARGLLESPVHSHADTVANIEVAAEITRQIGAKPF